MEEEPDPNLRVGGLFLEREHFDEYKTRAEREFSTHLRFAPESFRAKSVRSLDIERVPDGFADKPYRLGLSHLRRFTDSIIAS